MPSNRPSTYRPNRAPLAAARNATATQARQDEALRYREQGYSYASIASWLGYRAAQGAAEACRAARARRAQVEAVITTAAPQRRVTTSFPRQGRTFGLEIEFYGITPQAAVDALAGVGIAASFEGYTHTVLNRWKIVTDASVTSTGTGRSVGLELVSPILQGEAGFAEAAKAVKALRDAGAKQNRTCGVHVHIGMDGLNGAQIMGVFDLYTKNQRNINGLVSRSRHNNRYCEVGVRTYEQGYLQRLRGATTVTSIKEVVRGLDRFRTVNLTAYAKYGTVEFRQHQGTLNGKKLVSWVKFLLAIVEAGSNGTDGEFANLSDLLGSLTMDATTTAYLGQRADRLAQV